ncbi:MAG: GNAT family N-acetyltransferase, partial [Spirochaetota bacterium]
RAMRTADRICRAVLVDSRVVGWIGGLSQYEGNVWELHPLAVHPDLHGRGIGRRLVEDFEREVAERGGLTIMIGTDDEAGMTSLSGVDLYQNLTGKLSGIQNLRRHPYEFYERLGYTIVGVMPDANGIGKPDIYMAKAVRRIGSATNLAPTTNRDDTGESSR